MKRLNISIKLMLNFLGGILSIVGIFFVFYKIRVYVNEINFHRFNINDWFVIVFSTVIYCASNFMLARAWWHILKLFQINFSYLGAMKIFGSSQLAKYVPGNIFHLAGRQSLGMAANFKAIPLAKSIIWELGLIVFTGSLFGILIMPLFFSKITIFWSVLLFLCVVIIVWFFLCRMVSISIATAFIWYLVFLSLSGIVFIIILIIINKSIFSISKITILCGAYIIAWLLGLIMPGAPAGLGIREMALLFLLKGIIFDVDLVLAVFLGRIVTVAGDFLFFLTTFFVKSNNKIT